MARILFEKDGYWVAKHAKGFLEVFKAGLTHSTRVATIDFRFDQEKQLRLAKAEINRRLKAAA